MFAAGRLLFRPTQTQVEIGLETLFLALSSLFASFFYTRLADELKDKRSFREKGVEIAKGIIVLKRRVDELKDWVAGKRNAPRSHPGVDPILEHIEQTLIGCRDLTDAALGGVGAFMGDTLTQYESVKEQISLTRIEAFRKTTKIQHEIQQKLEADASSHEIMELQTRLQQVKLEEQNKISRLSLTSALPVSSEPLKRPVVAKCPNCEWENLTEIVDRPGQTLPVSCEHCGQAFNTHVIADHRVITRTMAQKNRQNPAETLTFDQEQWALLIAATLDADQTLKSNELPRSPLILQQLVLEKSEKLLHRGVTASAIRKFFTSVYEGRAFAFPSDSVPNFRTIYVNDLSRDRLLRAFARTRLRNTPSEVLTPEYVESLSQLVFGTRDPDAINIIRETVVNLAEPHKKEVDGA